MKPMLIDVRQRGRRRALMCSKCDELDRRIEHYQRLSRMLLDQRAIEGLTLIENTRLTKKRFIPKACRPPVVNSISNGMSGTC